MALFKRSRPDPTNAPPRSKWKRRLLGAFLTLLSLIVLAPVLIARTPLRNWIIALALPQFQGDIHIGEASLWWGTPPVFADLEVRDIAGRTLLSIPRIEGSKSLVEMLCNPFDLGEFRLTEPAVHVVCSNDSTNLETALAYWLQKQDNQPEAALALEGIAVRAECTHARLLIQDEDTGRAWTLDPVDISAALPRDRRTPIQFKLSAVVTDDHPSGRLDVELSAHLVEMKDDAPRLLAGGELHAQELPLAVAVPILRRFEPQLKLAGRLNTNLTLREGDGQAGSPDARLEGGVSAVALTLSHPLLGSDIPNLARVEGSCRLTLNGSRLLIEQAEVQSEVGKASLAGTVDLGRSLRDTLYQPGNRVDAQVDLARLAGLAPNTLHLTKDTQITSGTLSLHVGSSLRSESVRWEGDLRTSDLQGLYQGQRITWKEPFALVFAAHQDANVLPVFERFRCDSDFLRLEMSGSLNEWTARGDFNLGKLSEHLAGFVDLGPLRLQGEGTLRMASRRGRGGHRLEGDMQLTQLNLTDGGGQSWREDGVTVRLDVVGEVAGGAYRINAGGLHVLAGNDGIDFDLLEPIADVKALRAASARVRVHGDLARCQGRVRSLTGALEGMRMTGQFELDGRLRYQPETVQLEDIKVTGHAVHVDGLGLCVDEPTLDFTTSGRWLTEKETLELQQTRLNCPTLTVQAPALSLGKDPAGAVQLTTSATVQGDVARLHRCLLTPPPNTPDTLGGVFAGRIDLRPDDGRQDIQLDLNVQNVTFGSPATPVWREPRIHVSGHGVYDLLKDSFRIVHLYADSTTLNCEATGQIAALSGDMEMSLEGKLGYNLEKLEPQLRPFLGQSVKLSGQDSRPFRIAGALTGPGSLLGRLRGEAGLNWQTLQAMGCQIGAADVRGQLAEGCVRISPIQTTLNQGRLRLEPTLRLVPAPLEVQLAKGRTIDHARLTPAVCAGGLGYALPVLADVAQAEGELSLDLDSGRVPMTDPMHAQMTGRVIIHSAQVSPGPLVRELSVLLKGPATLTLAKENVVSFQVVNGRVSHSGLELHFPELTVRTSGSVGMDGSLSLVAEMPVPPKWLASSKLARAAVGQTIRLPIGGTLSNPKIDEQALRTASARFARDAAENVIRQELDGKLKNEAENGLKKLFRPRK